MASTYLTRTPSSSGTQTKATISVWFKRSDLSANQCIFSTGNNNFVIKFSTTDKLGLYDYNGSSMDFQLTTTQVFRDVSAWYHIVLSLDSTQSTSSDRVKLYVNGSLISAFDTTGYPSQNYNFKVNGTLEHFIGRLSGLSQYFDGSISHFHMVDGTAYDASTFGSTDATTGIWKPKTAPSVTYGTNGFFLKFENSAAFGTDSSGNSNTFSVNGTMTQTIDTPSNVFATINALDNYRFNGTFSNGNNTVASNASVESYWTSTLGASTGKWYWEVKLSSSGSGRDFIGIADKVAEATNFTPYSGNNKMRSYYGYTGVSVIGSTGTAFGATFGTGDIIGVAMDLDNHKIYYSKNGVFQGSGNPSTGANGLDIDTSPASGFYYAQGANIHNTASTFQTNFGNGYFGTTAVSSAQNPDDGIGIFEYDVPAGYRALCTKSINAEEYS